MGVDAAQAAQPLLIAHQPHAGHPDRCARADGDVADSAVPPNIDRDLPAQLLGEFRKEQRQLRIDEMVALNAQIIQRSHPLQRCPFDAADISVNFQSSSLRALSP